MSIPKTGSRLAATASLEQQKEAIAYAFPLDHHLDLVALCRLCRPVLQGIPAGLDERSFLDAVRFLLLRELFPDSHFEIPQITISVPTDTVRTEFVSAEVLCNDPAFPPAAEHFLDVLQLIFEREEHELPFDPLRAFEPLRREELDGSRTAEEYRRLQEAMKEQRIYALLRLSAALTPYQVLGHMAGVHHVALSMARQLHFTDVDVDLALISGAAMIHDLGKLGCSVEESGRVPYLHYYYTWKAAEQLGLPETGSIASNHSVWDLELANLPVESLLLIYADFRVKSIFGKDGEEVRIWSLKDSYDIILNKLDNVDETKRLRYARVYARLRDFENYLVSLGCGTEFLNQNEIVTPHFGTAPESVPAPLKNDGEVAAEYRHLAVSANLRVMRHMSDADFIGMIESIRGERNWQLVRSYLTVLGDYSAYIKQEQKDTALQVLYDLMFHTDGDIRRRAASAAGKILSDYEIAFTKTIPDGVKAPMIGATLGEVWKAFLHKMLFPGHLLPEQHRRWIGYSMKTVLRELLGRSDGEKKREVLRIFMEYFKSTRWDSLTCFFLLDCVTDIPYEMCNDQQRKLVFRFVRSFLNSEEAELCTAALRLADTWISEGGIPDSGLRTELLKEESDETNGSLCILYLRRHIRAQLDPQYICDPLNFDSSRIYLENQRAELPWIYKLVNLKILREQHRGEGDHYQYASHLLNMLQFTDRVVCKLQAGRDLVDVTRLLDPTQKYEILLELLSTVEIGEYSTTRYIPSCLGSIFVSLPAEDMNELLERFRKMIDSTNPRVVIITLETIGCILRLLPNTERGEEESAIYSRIVRKLEGMLFCGIVDYRKEVAQEAFYVIGHELFDTDSLTLAQKTVYFNELGRRILAMMNWSFVELFYYNAAGLNAIYRYLSDYEIVCGGYPGEGRTARAAFFPGTFDPFSLGHKAIVKEIASLGFTVYLAIDEFSWSKKTQPYRIRRKIAAMSIADIMDAYLFPAETPVNIANPEDMKKLSSVFGPREVYLVIGSDVIAHASAYRMPPEEGSVHSFPHILFSRNESGEEDPAAGILTGPVIRLKLPPYLETMSSTRIRENVGSGKDIGNLVERRVQNFIYARNLYSMEPMYKKAAHSRSTVTEILRGEELRQRIPDDLPSDMASCLTSYLNNLSVPANEKRLLLIRENGTVRGGALYRDTDVSGLYAECGDLDLAQRLRNLTAGRIVVLHRLFGNAHIARDERMTALNEVMAVSQRDGISYSVCFTGEPIADFLVSSGFRRVTDTAECYLVDMRKPLVLLFDTGDTIKEPLGDLDTVRREIWHCHKRLTRALSALYPGNLVLSLESEILNDRLIRMIRECNTMPEKQYTEKRLGEKMCVPFSKVLKGVTIPECVTKDLNTEKLYDTDLQHFEICELPQDSPLDIQLRTIGSFRRPVIMVDDFYHKGYRMNTLEPLLKKEKITLDRLLVGVLSGRGRDLAELRHKKVDSVYFVPNMRSWHIESELLPLIGGDGIRSDETAPSAASSACLPSINQILPYEVPPYLHGSSLKAFYALSRVCIENAAAVYNVLEKEYRKQFGRRLTLERLGEVMAAPRVPDSVLKSGEALKKTPSEILASELNRLARLEHLLDIRFREN